MLTRSQWNFKNLSAEPSCVISLGQAGKSPWDVFLLDNSILLPRTKANLMNFLRCYKGKTLRVNHNIIMMCKSRCDKSRASLPLRRAIIKWQRATIKVIITPLTSVPRDTSISLLWKMLIGDKQLFVYYGPHSKHSAAEVLKLWGVPGVNRVWGTEYTDW